MNLSTLEIKAIDAIKTHRITMPIYRKLKSRQNSKRFKVQDINTFNPCKTTKKDIRFNLVLPTLRATRVFAGISSALSFFLKLTAEEPNCRIVVIGNEEYSKKNTYDVNQYSYAQKTEYSSKEIVFYSDSSSIDIGVNDLFVFTSWKTAFAFMPILQWQSDEYKLHSRKAIYLIQDYEPGFFAWSSEYSLAESTYSATPNDIIAVFNSRELSDYFDTKGYRFYDECYFTPVLNSSLKDYLLQASQDSPKKRERRILIYGRPSEQRNAFEVIRYSLELWSETYAAANEWEIVSLGEGFSDIQLKNNTIISKGKVGLDEYAEYMLSSYAGISLMVSPHPSYPPLEMSTFGVRTITNKFESKDLASFNSNIVSIDSCSPYLIAQTLTSLCDDYVTHRSKLCTGEEYLNGNSLNTAVFHARKSILEFV